MLRVSYLVIALMLVLNAKQFHAVLFMMSVISFIVMLNVTAPGLLYHRTIHC
jgi:hypothetical protein